MAPDRIVFCALVSTTAAFLSVPAPAAADTSAGPAEIIVTARKREESLQEVPLAISTFSAEELQERNIQTIYDVASFTPNFSFNRNSVGRRLDAPAIRGQFTPLANFGSEGNVAFYVDGVYVSGTAASLTVNNVERIEVLKGPQAALFGRAAFAGAVNYITQTPTDEFAGEVDLKAGEERDYKAAAWIGGPIVEDRLRFYASVGYEGFEGEWKNSLVPCQPATATGENCTTFDPRYESLGGWPANQPPSTDRSDFTELGGESSWNATGKLLWTVSEALELRFKAEYTETDDDHFASLFQPDMNCFDDTWFCGELTAEGLQAKMNIADLADGAVNFQEVNGESVTAAPAPFIGTQTETARYLVEALVDVGTWSAVARASYNDQTLESYRDLDRSPYLGPLYVNLFDAGELQKWEDQSYELRLLSDQQSRLRGQMGAYFYDSEQISYQREFVGFCNRVEFGLPYINGEPSWNLNNEKQNTAFFGGVDYDITDTVTFSAEARYAKDTPEARASNGVVAKDNFYSVTPRFILQWQPTPDLNLFAKAAKGNKPGGFYYGYFDAPVARFSTEQALQDGNARIKEEEAWTYELGAKTQWADQRITANVAVFYIDWTNQAINQVENVFWQCPDTNISTDVANNFIRNAGESQVVGGEIELSFIVTDFLTMRFAYGLADTKLEEYNSLVLEELLGAGNGSAKGKSAPRVPKHSFTASAMYQKPLGDEGAEWFVRGDYIYNAKSYTDVDNYNWIGPLNLMNARVGIENDSWTAAVYVDNLTDDETPLLASEFPNFAEFPSNVSNAFHIVPRRGRNVGLSLEYRF